MLHREQAHLFLIRLEHVDFSNLWVPFINQCLWHGKHFTVQSSAESPGEWVMEEPLLHIPLIQTRMFLQTFLWNRGCTKLTAAVGISVWKSAVAYRKATDLQTYRVASELLDGSTQNFRGTDTGRKHGQCEWNLLFWVRNRKWTGIWRTEETFWESALLLYSCVEVTHYVHMKGFRSVDVAGTVWRRPPSEYRWGSMYEPPLQKQTTELRWRIIHQAVAKNRHVTLWNPAVTSLRRFCGQWGTLLLFFLIRWLL